MSVTLRRVHVGPGGETCDVRLAEGVVASVRPSRGEADPVCQEADEVMDGCGLTLLPGLVDHHLHVGAWLRSRRSIALGQPRSGLGERIRRSQPDGRGWTVFFGLDHHHEIPEALDAIDGIDSPVLVAHRTGHAVLVNAAAARELGVAGGTAVRHEHGLWSRALGPADAADELAHLQRLRDGLLADGVVAIQDATPYPDGTARRREWLAAALAPVRVSFMSSPACVGPPNSWTKILHPDAAGSCSKPVAIHAVEPREIVEAIDLIRGSTEASRSRIEHASLCPPAIVEELAGLGATVCSNPAFLVERASALGPLSQSGEGEMLHPVAELRSAGVPVIFGSDAPVTSPGVWASVCGASMRGSSRVPFAGAAMTLAQALGSVTSFASDRPADAWVGRSADVALVNLDSVARGERPQVIGTWIAGVQVYGDRRLSPCRV